MNKTLVTSLLGISMICGVLSAAPAHAAAFLEGFAASALVSTGFDATSDGSNSNEKRIQLGLIHDDAAEYVLGGIPSQSLKSVLAEMKTEIKNKQPDYDLTQVNDHDLALAVLKMSILPN